MQKAASHTSEASLKIPHLLVPVPLTSEQTPMSERSESAHVDASFQDKVPQTTRDFLKVGPICEFARWELHS